MPAPALPLVLALALASAQGAEGPDAALYRVRLDVDVPLTLAAAAGATLPYALPHLITPACPCSRSEVNRLDRFAIGHHSAAAAAASDATVAAAVLLPPVADVLRLGRGAALGADLVVYAETLAVSSALVVAAKYTVQRPLPLTYEGDPRYVKAQGGYRSFYSGHTTTAVSALTAAAWTIRWRDGEQGWPWAVVALAGTSVGVERVLAGRHFPTDVAVGALAGFAVGTAVPWLHLRRGGRVALVPAPGGVGLAGTL